MSSSSLGASVASDDDDDGAAYKMESMGTIPIDIPSRDLPSRRRDDGEEEESSSPPPPPPTPDDRTETSSATIGSMPLLSSPNGSSSHSREREGEREVEPLQSSNKSFEISVDARQDEPLTRNDVYHASTETFPTSNVLPGSPVRTSQPPSHNHNHNKNKNKNKSNNNNRRNVMNYNSVNTAPMSNISGSEGQLTLGDTTTSDLTMTTGGTFDTYNAVVGLDTEDGVHDSVDENSNDENEKAAALRSIQEQDDIPLDQLFAIARRNNDDTNDVDGTKNTNNDTYEYDPPHVTMDTAPPPTDDIEAPTSSWQGPPTQPRESKSRGSPLVGASSVSHAKNMETKDDKENDKENKEKNMDTEHQETAIEHGTATTRTNAESAPPIDSSLSRTDRKQTNNNNNNNNNNTKKPYRTYIFRSVVVIVVLFIVILSSVLFYTRDNRNEEKNNDNNNNNNNNDNDNNTLSPSSTQPPGSTPIPSSPPPSLNSAGNYELTAVLDGQNDGNRFGTIVSLTSTGDFLAVLRVDPLEPIQTFTLRQTVGWVPFASLPREQAIFSSSNNNNPQSISEAGADLNVATTPEGFPAVAISSTTSGFRVYEHNGSAWVSRGQPLQWQSANNSREESTVLSTAICLSFDASVMAAGYVSSSGDALLVRTFAYDPNAQTWNQIGDVIQRLRPEGSPPFLSITLSLSGNGRVVSVGDWRIADPQVMIDTYEFNDGLWTLMGPTISVPWGPVYTALSTEGTRLAVVNIALGTTYEWDGSQWNQFGGGVLGGSAVSMSGEGTKLFVGDALQNTASLLDYADQQWQRISLLTGDRLSRFGESVAMSIDGNTLSIGAPFANLDGTNVGQIFLYSSPMMIP